ncbi:MAG: phosphoglycerate kinase [Candidatus Celaenobacter antarcticus]|nr:phosphoglycerate kinase [Candidatus Celaenobacter antarcticus]
MHKKTISDIDVTGKKVLVRVDFNVPLDEYQNITDDTRIEAALPTINFLLKHNAAVILMSHLGRPKGEDKSTFSLEPVAKRLEEIIGKKVQFTHDCIGEETKRAAENLKPGEILLLENTRFHPEEKKNDPEFAKELASLGDIFVNDAFGTAHRAHASNVGVAEYIPSVLGFLVEKEIEFLNKALINPQKPYTAILGGAKVSDKIDLIEQLLDKADSILIGGAMMYTFLKALGYKVGKSLVEDDKIPAALEITERAKKKGVSLYLPEDTVVAKEMAEGTEFHSVPIDAIPDNMIGLDIGILTVRKYAEIIKLSKTVIWNGPMGMFEISSFSHGTKGIARAVAACPGITIIGGGDSAAAIEKFGFADKVSHISTGGGASLEYLSGKELPGIAIIPDK